MTASAPSRDRILDAARTLFEQGGADGVSMRKVAAMAGLTPMAIYRHFADRDALIDALVLDALDAWRRRLEAIDVADPLAWFDAMGEAFLAYALEEPRRFEAAFLTRAKSARQFPDDFAAGRSPPGQLWLPRIAEAQAAGQLDPAVPPLDIGLGAWALGQGLITLYRAGRFAGSEAEFRQFYQRAWSRLVRSYNPVRKPS